MSERSNSDLFFLGVAGAIAATSAFYALKKHQAEEPQTKDTVETETSSSNISSVQAASLGHAVIERLCGHYHLKAREATTSEQAFAYLDKVLSLTSLSTSLPQGQDLVASLSFFLTRVNSFLSCDGSRLFLVDEDHGGLKLFMSTYFGDRSVGSLAHNSLAMKSFKKTETVVVGDLKQAKESSYALMDVPYQDADSPSDNKQQAVDVCSTVLVPVRDSWTQKVWGVLQACDQSTNHFHTEAVCVLELLAFIAGNLVNEFHVREETTVAVQQAEALKKAATILSSEMDGDGVVARILNICYEIVPSERVALFLVDEKTQELELRVSKDAKGIRMPMTMGVAGHSACSGEIVNVKNVYTDPRFNPMVDKQTGFHSRSMLCIPIRDPTGDKVVAVIQAVNRLGSEVFSRKDELILQSITLSAAIALQKSNLYMSALREKRRNGALLDMVKSLSTKDDLDKLVKCILTFSRKILECERVMLYFVDLLKQEVWSRESDVIPTGIRLPLGKGIAGYVAATGNTYRTDNASADPQFARDLDTVLGSHTRNVLCVAIRDKRGVVQAVLEASNKEGSNFNPEDEAILHALSEEVSIRLENKRYDVIYEKALVDMRRDSDEDDDEWASSANIKSILSLYTSAEALMQKHGKPVIYAKENRLEGHAEIVTAPTQPLGSPIILNGKATPIQDWSFDVFALSDEDQHTLFREILSQLELTSRFNLESARVSGFFSAVKRNYRPNPYHNFHHALSVFHVSYLIVSTTKALDLLTSLDKLGTVIAALGHDVDHPGNNNMFEINSASLLAVRYNDQSVLENHHAATLFHILQNEENNILSSLVHDQQGKEVRKSVIAAILATDMAHHAEHTQRIASMVGLKGFSKDRKDDRQLLMNTIVHSADISGQILPPELGMKWSEMVTTEFKAQAERERAAGIPVTPFMDNLVDRVSLAHTQLSFCDYIVAPLWLPMSDLFPELKVCIDNLNRNRALFQQIIDEAAMKRRSSRQLQ